MKALTREDRETCDEIAQQVWAAVFVNLDALPHMDSATIGTIAHRVEKHFRNEFALAMSVDRAEG